MDILEKEKGSTADRPHWIAAQEILSKGMRMTLEHNNDRFRRLRRVVQTNLQPKFVQTWRAMLLEDAKTLIVRILDDPNDHQAHALGCVPGTSTYQHVLTPSCRYSASVIIRVTYGKNTPTSNDDPEVQRIHQVVASTQKAMRPGAFLVDRIPIIKYLPGYGRQLNEWHRFEIKLFREQLARVKCSMASVLEIRFYIQHNT